jgi:hypothetical protein
MKVNEAAALHYAAGCLAEQDVPPGRYELSGVRVVIDFPDSAALERSEGSAGGGLDRTKPAELKVSLLAALLFAERSGLTGPPARRLWETCIRDALAGGKVEEHTPPEAELALDAIEQERGPQPDGTRKTPAKRTDPKLAEVTVLAPGQAVPRRRKAAA